MNSNVPENYRFGGGAAQTTLHPAVFVFMLIAVALIILLPRKYIVGPFLACILLSPFGQQLYVAGAHLFVGRILILSGWLRLLRIQRSSPMISEGLTLVDRIFLLWAVARATATFLESMEMQAAVNQIGFLWDSLGGFFLLRFLIRDEKDIERVTKIFAVLVFVLAVTMMNERVNGLNVFGYIGGQLTPALRDGAIRAQGPFASPIPAGTFGGAFLCLFLWLWRSGTSRFIGLAGIAGSLLVVAASSSSTPLMTVVAGLLAVALWPCRNQMRLFRWGLVGGLIALQCVMDAPVWMIINHVDLVGGNSAYHRAMLIDGFVRHFRDWWLMGVASTAAWGYDLWDQANQFVSEGEKGGLLTFVCFLSLVSVSFKRLGIGRRRAWNDSNKEWLFWSLGAALFSYVVSFFGISFSDQTIYAWFAFLAIICAATVPANAAQIAEDRLKLSVTTAPEGLRLASDEGSADAWFAIDR